MMVGDDLTHLQGFRASALSVQEEALIMGQEYLYLVFDLYLFI